MASVSMKFARAKDGLAAVAFFLIATLNETSSAGLTKKAITWLMAFGCVTDAATTALNIHCDNVGARRGELILMIAMGVTGLFWLRNEGQLVRASAPPAK